MAEQLVKELINAGIHFGHRVSRWNPKMKPYIYGKRNLIHIINVKETIKGLLLAKKFLARTVAEGKDVLVVGTKRQARKAVEEQATRAGMHWVTDRWLGGTLTNFREIRKRVGRLEELEQMDADGLLDTYSKKEGASLRREMRKIRRNLGGIRKMTRLPGAMLIGFGLWTIAAAALLLVTTSESHAVKEANKLHIPVVCLLDTECDPDLVDIPIPGNDDAMRAIELIVRELCDAIVEGRAGRTKVEDQAEVAPPRRRTRRKTTARAETPVEPSTTEQEPQAEQTAQQPEQTATPDPAETTEET